jgi:hypothetical protein
VCVPFPCWGISLGLFCDNLQLFPRWDSAIFTYTYINMALSQIGQGPHKWLLIKTNKAMLHKKRTQNGLQAFAATYCSCQ